jgi:shikimate dehydrogenase
MRQVVLLGAGGAGAAVGQAVLGLGAQRLTVIDAQPDRADRLAAALNNRPDGLAGRVVTETTGNLASRLRTADGLINATPIGMTAHPGMPLDPQLLRPEMWVADIVYRPLWTELLRRASEVGCRTMHGGGMVVFQAAEALRLFTGRAPDAERMYRHFTALVGGADA